MNRKGYLSKFTDTGSHAVGGSVYENEEFIFSYLKKMRVSIINIRLELLEAMPASYYFYFDIRYFRILG